MPNHPSNRAVCMRHNLSVVVVLRKLNTMSRVDFVAEPMAPVLMRDDIGQEALREMRKSLCNKNKRCIWIENGKEQTCEFFKIRDKRNPLPRR